MKFSPPLLILLFLVFAFTGVYTYTWLQGKNAPVVGSIFKGEGVTAWFFPDGTYWEYGSGRKDTTGRWIANTSRNIIDVYPETGIPVVLMRFGRIPLYKQYYCTDPVCYTLADGSGVIYRIFIPW